MTDVPEGVHRSHCNLGDYEGVCKYGEDDCPVLSEIPYEEKFICIDGQYWKIKDLKVIWYYLQRKALFVNSGFEILTPSDNFAYLMLKPHKYFLAEDEDIVNTGYDFAEMNKDD